MMHCGIFDSGICEMGLLNHEEGLDRPVWHEPLHFVRFDDAMQSYTLLGTPAMLPSSAFTLATQVSDITVTS